MAKREEKERELRYAYSAERRRIKQFVSRAEKRGYTFDKDIIPKSIAELKKEGIQITQSSIKKLEKIKSSDLYLISTFKNPETGETYSGIFGLEYEAKKSQEKRRETLLKQGKISPEKKKKPEKIKQPKEKKEKKPKLNITTKNYLKGKSNPFSDIKIKKKKEVKPDIPKMKKANSNKVKQLDKQIFGDTEKKRKNKTYPKKKKKEKTQSARDEFYEDRSDMGTTGEGPKLEDLIIDNVEDAFDKIDFSTLERIEDEINNFTVSDRWNYQFQRHKQRARDTIKSILENAINTYGRKQVALNCQNNADEIIMIVMDILYDSNTGGRHHYDEYKEKINFEITRFAAILKGSPLNQEESIKITEIAEILTE